MKKISLVTALAAIAVAQPASAQIYGSLANFDAVNDTGYVAHGFEIQIEDPSFTHSNIYSVFGLDRNFGVPPTSVERYGAPSITDLPGVGVLVRYAATFANNAWSVGTPTGPYPNAGDSCWPLGNPAYNSGTLTCDHFGVGTLRTPAKVSYNWLVDPSNSGTLVRQSAAVPAVAFIYQPPAPNQPPAPQPVVAEIEAHLEPNQAIGTPYWVKVFSKHVDHNVKLEDLMKGNADVPNDNEVETEFSIFQAGDASGKKVNDLVLNPGDAGLVLRYEFYKYIGPLKADGSVNCSGGGKGNGGKGGGGGGGGGGGPLDCGGLGDYAGAQMAAFNAVQIPAVPEPESYALFVAGLGMIGAVARRRRAFG